jgi:hypothetical protein
VRHVLGLHHERENGVISLGASLDVGQSAAPINSQRYPSTAIRAIGVSHLFNLKKQLIKL